MEAPFWNINLADESAKGLLASAASESLAQQLQFVRRDGRTRAMRFLLPNGASFDDAGIDSGSLVEAAIGTPDDPPSSGAFSLTYNGSNTGLTSLAYNITGDALATALNANAAITADGGVSVTQDGGLYIISFTTTGAKSLLVFNKGTLAPAASSTAIIQVQSGDGTTNEVQLLVLKKGYLAYSDDFAPDAAGSISQSSLQTGTANLPEITRISISGTPDGGNWTFSQSQKQIFNIYCPSGTTGYVGGSYIIAYDGAGTVGIWVDEGSTTMPSAVAACNRSIAITGVLNTDTSTQVASKWAVILDADSNFVATSAASTVTVTQADAGARGVPTVNGVYGAAQTTQGYSISASFPYNASASAVASSLGTYYSVSQIADYTWNLTARSNGTQATITLDGTGLTWPDIWRGTLNLSTWAMYVEFAAADADEITRTFEVQFTEPGGNPVKAVSVPCTIRRDVIDVTGLTNTPQSFGLFNTSITGYTGGGSTNLDGLTATNRAVGSCVQWCHTTLGFQVYRVESSTDATSSPAKIRPADYNASTNAKVFFKIN